ncbi:hypothetical protein M9Y10_009722 [Tritrichomonas musculus]|uniref:Uncharacterized protein n=1 Tax=Tritrichomonas musculus TaxID=1915356 RepID=A0ABR2IQI5_9EUKA
MDSKIETEDAQENIDFSDRFKKLEDTIKTQIEQVEEELNLLHSSPSSNSSEIPDQNSQNQQKNSNLQQLRHLQTYSSTTMLNELNRFSKVNLFSNYFNNNNNSNSNNNDANNSSDTDLFLNNDNNLTLPAKTSRVFRSNNFENQNISACWEQVLNFLHQGKDEEAIYALVRVVQRLVDEKASKRTQQEKASKSYVDSLYERVLGNVKGNLMQQVEDSYDDLENQVISITKQIGELKQFFQKELRDVTIQIAILKEDNDAVNDLNSTNGIKNTSRSSGRSSSRARSAFSVFSAKG